MPDSLQDRPAVADTVALRLAYWRSLSWNELSDLMEQSGGPSIQSLPVHLRPRATLVAVHDR